MEENPGGDSAALPVAISSWERASGYSIGKRSGSFQDPVSVGLAVSTERGFKVRWSGSAKPGALKTYGQPSLQSLGHGAFLIKTNLFLSSENRGKLTLRGVPNHFRTDCVALELCEEMGSEAIQAAFVWQVLSPMKTIEFKAGDGVGFLHTLDTVFLEDLECCFENKVAQAAEKEGEPEEREARQPMRSGLAQAAGERYAGMDFSSPRYFPLSALTKAGEFKFIEMDRHHYEDASFLVGRRMPGKNHREWNLPAKWFYPPGNKPPPAPVIILHVALACSTLFSRCYGEVSNLHVLREPCALTNLVHPILEDARENKGEADKLEKMLLAVLHLYDRRYPGQDGVMIKTHDRVLGLAEKLMEVCPESPFLYMFMDLEKQVLATIRKPERDKWIKNSYRDNFAADWFLSIPCPDRDDLTAAQSAALMWVVRMARVKMLMHTRPERIKGLNGDKLVDYTEDVMQLTSEFFGVKIDAAKVAGLKQSPVFTRHSKKGKRYKPKDRDRVYAKAEKKFEEEAREAVQWVSHFLDGLKPEDIGEGYLPFLNLDPPTCITEGKVT